MLLKYLDSFLNTLIHILLMDSSWSSLMGHAKITEEESLFDLQFVR
jgi:hypothetical protein